MKKRAEPIGAERSDADRTLVLSRVFDAPREAVFRAWIDPAQIARWIGPRSVKAEIVAMDARAGGVYRIAMHHEKGGVSTVEGVYREVAVPERLVFTWGWQDDSGKPGHETVVAITFKAIGEKTEMTLRHERFENKTRRDSHKQGWTGSFDKLAEILAGKPGRV